MQKHWRQRESKSHVRLTAWSQRASHGSQPATQKPQHNECRRPEFVSGASLVTSLCTGLLLSIGNKPVKKSAIYRTRMAPRKSSRGEPGTSVRTALDQQKLAPSRPFKLAPFQKSVTNDYNRSTKFPINVVVVQRIVKWNSATKQSPLSN
jgi:hypothetical protein